MTKNGLYYKSNATGEASSVCDLDGNVILDNITNLELSGNDKYYFISMDGQLGFLNRETKETTLYDDATVFSNGYAFVTVDGMGHFINDKLEAVSSDIPSTSASISHDARNLIYMENNDTVYTINFPSETVE